MLSVVVPTFNERDNVAELIRRTLAAFALMGEEAELLIVDDNSPDGTAEQVRKVATELGVEDRVRAVVRTQDRGLAQAVTEGFRRARGDVLAVLDADLSHPPELLPRLLDALRNVGADFAIGSRYVPGGGTQDWPLLRRIISRFAGWLARPLVAVRDPTSGYFALRRDALKNLEIKPRGYKIGLELLARARPRRVVEVPFVFRDRERGKSKLGRTVIIAYLIQLAALYRERFPRLVGYLQFSLVGLLGMAVDATVFTLAYWYLGLNHLGAAAGGFLAQTISFLVAASTNFLLNSIWTFRERALGARLDLFLAVSAGGFFIRSAVFEALLRVGHESATPLIAGVISAISIERFALFAGIIVGSLWNFFGSRRWAFPESAAVAPAALPAPGELAARAWVAGLLLAYVLMRVFVGAQMGLAADEAYYWQWSRHLAFGYYDHPPMIAYLIAAGTRLLGNNALGVRLIPMMMTVGIAWMVSRMALQYWRTQRAALWSIVVFVAVPLFAVGGLISTPDTPLLFFWTTTVMLALYALRSERNRDWILAGVVAGFGVLSKYPMVLLLVALLLALLTIPRGRRALVTAGPWLAIASAGLICIPLLVWTLNHGPGSVLYQLHHGLGAAAGATRDVGGLKTVAGFVLVQVGIITPLLFGLLIWALARAVRTQLRAAPEPFVPSQALSRGEVLPFLLYPVVVPLLVFAAAAWLTKSGPNWTAPAYVTAAVILGGELAQLTRRREARAGAILAWAGVAFAVVVSLYIQVEAVHPLVSYESGPFMRVHDRSGFRQWAARVTDHYAEGSTQPLILASSYQLASLLAFYLPDNPQTDSPFESGSGSEYVLWRTPVQAGEPALYFTATKDDGAVERLYSQYRLVDSYADTRRGVALGHLYVYYGKLKAREPTQAGRAK